MSGSLFHRLKSLDVHLAPKLHMMLHMGPRMASTPPAPRLHRPYTNPSIFTGADTHCLRSDITCHQFDSHPPASPNTRANTRCCYVIARNHLSRLPYGVGLTTFELEGLTSASCQTFADNEPGVSNIAHTLLVVGKCWLCLQ